MNKTIIITIVVAVVVGAGAFYGGMKYQQSKQSASIRQFAAGQFGGGQGFRAGAGGNRANLQAVMGQIITSANNSITVKLQDGSSKIVLLSSNTVINKAEQATAADLVVGTTVRITGQTNSDGSVTASNIQLNPMVRASPSPSPTP